MVAAEHKLLGLFNCSENVVDHVDDFRQTFLRTKSSRSNFTHIYLRSRMLIFNFYPFAEHQNHSNSTRIFKISVASSRVQGR